MRRILLAAALAAAAAPAWAAKAPPVVDPDPMTVSGRFDLPKASAASAGRLKLGTVTVDPALAAKAKLDPAALQAAVATAAERSLRNFGYAVADAPQASIVDLALSAEAEAVPGGVRTTIHLTATGPDPCFARSAEGRFKVLPRERSGTGKRVFAVAASIAVGLATGPGGVNTFIPAEFDSASAENRARNAARVTSPDEGVAPAFNDAAAAAYGEMSATRLALADYIRQLGEAPACKAASAAAAPPGAAAE